MAVKPAKRSSFCSGCGGRAPRYDRRRREWRHLDVCGFAVSLEYETWRVECPRCGVTTEMVSWAAAGSGFTHAFEEVVAYLAQRTDKTTVSTRIGIDELSYRRHHEYVTVVTDHDSGRVVWVSPAKDAATVLRFFADLGAERTAQIEMITIDRSNAFTSAVAEAAPHPAGAPAREGLVSHTVQKRMCALSAVRRIRSRPECVQGEASCSSMARAISADSGFTALVHARTGKPFLSTRYL